MSRKQWSKVLKKYYFLIWYSNPDVVLALVKKVFQLNKTQWHGSLTWWWLGEITDSWLRASIRWEELSCQNTTLHYMQYNTLHRSHTVTMHGDGVGACRPQRVVAWLGCGQVSAGAYTELRWWSWAPRLWAGWPPWFLSAARRTSPGPAWSAGCGRSPSEPALSGGPHLQRTPEPTEKHKRQDQQPAEV